MSPTVKVSASDPAALLALLKVVGVEGATTGTPTELPTVSISTTNPLTGKATASVDATGWTDCIAAICNLSTGGIAVGDAAALELGIAKLLGGTYRMNVCMICVGSSYENQKKHTHTHMLPKIPSLTHSLLVIRRVCCQYLGILLGTILDGWW